MRDDKSSERKCYSDTITDIHRTIKKEGSILYFVAQCLQRLCILGHYKGNRDF